MPCLVKSPVKACVVQKIGSTGSVQTINHVIVKRKRLPVIFHGENFIGDRESYFDLGDAFRQSVKDLRQLGGIITVCVKGESVSLVSAVEKIGEQSSLFAAFCVNVIKLRVFIVESQLIDRCTLRRVRTAVPDICFRNIKKRTYGRSGLFLYGCTFFYKIIADIPVGQEQVLCVRSPVGDITGAAELFPAFWKSVIVGGIRGDGDIAL